MQNDEFCAGSPDHDGDGKTDGGTDACQGDSGGGLICSVRDKPVLVGIISWGKSCGISGAPGVYANVYKFTDWILEKVDETQNKGEWTTYK